MHKGLRFITVLQQRGVGYGIYFVLGVLWPKLRFALMQRLPHQQARIAAIGGLPMLRMDVMQQEARRLQRTQKISDFTCWSDYPVSAEFRRAIDKQSSSEIVIGRIDNDGRLQTDFGELPFVENISRDQFVPRRRFPLDIVLRDGYILIRKDFRGDRQRFTHEWYNLTRLQGRANVPPVYVVDEQRTLLYKGYIMGRTIRDMVVDAGAKILTVQTENDIELARLSETDRLYAVLQRGLDRFPTCFSEKFISAVEAQMNTVHAQGVAKLSLTYGNIIVDADEQPWFIDLESSEAFSSTEIALFKMRRDQDREKFNRIYGQTVLTEVVARRMLQAQAEKLGGWYAPIDFGNGLTIGGIHSIESGSGRWEYLNEHVMTPLVRGKRVLDLGCNNGIMPMLMLRAGAQHVTGIELRSIYVESAELVHKIFEWRDMCHYDFRVIQGNMAAIADSNWGEFDIVTALCTLYYLTPEDMAHVVRRVSEISPVMILQGNTSTRKLAADHKAEKSSLPFLQNVLVENGFPNIQIIAPANYSRPLLIGTR